MPRVKLQKLEILDNDLPSLCMICGEAPGETKHDTTFRLVQFPMNLLGIVGHFAAPKKFNMVTRFVEMMAGIGNSKSNSFMGYIRDGGLVRNWYSSAQRLGSLHAHFSFFNYQVCSNYSLAV